MLDFLATATVADVAETAASRKGGPRKQRNPEGLAIRIFKDGSIWPSTELVSKFDLEYTNKGEMQQGCGFDIIDTNLYPTFQVGKRVILISPVNRKAGKVDIFASTTYNDDDTPKSSVLDQGAKTFGKETLLPMLKDVYDIELTDDKEWEDLMVVAHPVTNEPWTLPNGRQIAYIPKTISRGDAKGQVSTVRRELPTFYVLVPATIVNAEQQPKAVPVEDETVANQPEPVESTSMELTDNPTTYAEESSMNMAEAEAEVSESLPATTE
jgi:hypothetical protein